MLTTIIQYIPQAWKAVTAVLTSAVAEYALAQQAGDVTAGHWVYIILTALAIGAGVWLKGNTPSTEPG